MAQEEILEPLDLYNKVYKDKVHEASEAYFDCCVEEAKIDLNQHRELVKRYNELEMKYHGTKKRANRLSTLRAVLIFLAFLGVILLLVSMFATLSTLAFTLLLVGGILLLLGSLALIFFVINSRLKDVNHKNKKHEQELMSLKQLCMKEVNKVIDRFDFNVPAKIIRENVPLIQLDDEFDMKKYDYLYHKYKIGDNNDKDTSAVFLLSGTIVGNPFLFMRNFYTHMVQKTYTGTRIVTYPMRVRTQRGFTTVMRTQTLVATVSQPAPAYEYETFVVYGNDAAPNLSFTRTPTIANLKTDKDIAKYVNSESKKLKDLGNKAIKQGKKFTPMTNTEFDSIFHAWNRDHEVEFRLLYTPLAQENTLKLLKRTTPDNPYGDDFKFTKKKCINYISSEHAKKLDVYMRPQRFRGYYDIDLLKKDFIAYIDEYFKSLYFDLAPLISVPLYQQMKPGHFIYQDDYDSLYPMLEDECIVNEFPPKTFAHPETITDTILKTKILKKHKNYDEVKVIARSYRGIDRVTHVNAVAANGMVYPVAVPWIEYIPVRQESVVNIARNHVDKDSYQSSFDSFNTTQGGKLKQDENFLFHHRFIVMMREALSDDDPKALDNTIDSIFGYKDDKNSSDSVSDSTSNSSLSSEQEKTKRKKASN